MMSAEREPVCVVIAAWNAADTIARAIGSALREPEVNEVVVVDDASSDGTPEVAQRAGAETDRVRVIRLTSNRGPAYARNCAIAESTAPLISVLDADDFFFEGRFGLLLEADNWDFIADNVVFIDTACIHLQPATPRFSAEPSFLDLKAFVHGSIPRRDKAGDLGFLHPVMRRAFLDAHRLRYNAALRLGEDYDLYARALMKGARFKIVQSCGYAALVRPNSLSRRHSTDDLRRLCGVDEAIAASCTDAARATVHRHLRQVRARFDVRRFLDVKAKGGLLAAIQHAITHPAALPAIVRGIAAAKLRTVTAYLQVENRQAGPRYLLPGTFPQGAEDQRK
jgi:succinoglycan biosynthesis protein ExoU